MEEGAGSKTALSMENIDNNQGTGIENEDDDANSLGDVDEIEVLLNFTPLEKFTESEFSKLSVANKKLSRNIDAVQGNLETLKTALITYGTGYNRVVRNVKHNTEIIDDVDNETGHLVGQIVDVQRSMLAMQNENIAVKNELKRKDRAIDELEKETKKKNLVISGLTEEINENLFLKVINVIQAICYQFSQDDIDCTYRVGTTQSAKTREVIVELYSRYVKEEVLKGRKKLRESELTRNIWINEDLPPRTRKSKGLMRDIMRRANEKQIPCTMSGDKLTCNNITYDVQYLSALPVGLRPEDMKTRIEGSRVGFMSEESFLSSFFPCQVTIDGYTFPSAEHAIQYKRSIVCEREDLGIQIKQTLHAKDAKLLSESIPHSKVWDSCKVGLVKCITKQKFTEDVKLRARLLETNEMKLEEATFDKFWGTGIPVFARELKSGRYSGKNTMGKILEEIREELRPREYTAATPTPTPTPTPKLMTATAATPAVEDSTHEVKDDQSNNLTDGLYEPRVNKNVQRDDASNITTTKEDAQSSTSLYIAGMSESVLRCMLLGLKNANTGLEAQQQIITRLNELTGNITGNENAAIKAKT